MIYFVILFVIFLNHLQLFIKLTSHIHKSSFESNLITHLTKNELMCFTLIHINKKIKQMNNFNYMDFAKDVKNHQILE